MTRPSRHWVVAWCNNSAHDFRVAPTVGWSFNDFNLLSTKALSGVERVPCVTGSKCSACSNMGFIAFHRMYIPRYQRGDIVNVARSCGGTLDIGEFPGLNHAHCRLCFGWRYVVPLEGAEDAAYRLSGSAEGLRRPPLDLRRELSCPFWASQEGQHVMRDYVAGKSDAERGKRLPWHLKLSSAQ